MELRSGELPKLKWLALLLVLLSLNSCTSVLAISCEASKESEIAEINNAYEAEIAQNSLEKEQGIMSAATEYANNKKLKEQRDIDLEEVKTSCDHYYDEDGNVEGVDFTSE